MKEVSLFVPYKNDSRFIFAQEYLKDKFVLAKSAEEASVVLLPIPVKKSTAEAFCGKTMYAGCVSFDLPGEKIFDYGADEAFQRENAFLTAQGAFCLAGGASQRAFFGADVLICGFGRIGSALARLLCAAGARVTVCSRSAASQADCMFYGYSHINFSDLKSKLNYDFIFNTVPHPVFTDAELKNVSPACIMTDLASFPGGIDVHSAASRNITLLDGRAIPKRFSPQSAGIAVGKTVFRMIEEGNI